MLFLKRKEYERNKKNLIDSAGIDCEKCVEAALGKYWGEFPDTLRKNVYEMSSSIFKDPVNPRKIEELGLSQAYRLYGLLNQSRKLPDVSLEGLSELPTIGAEFHFDRELEGIYENLFFLNMAQYHENSSIALSGRDDGVIEVRTNPSYYPVTVANWDLMKKIVPLDDAYFSLTVTPIPEDAKKLNQLKSLTNIIHADNYKSVKKFGVSYKERFRDISLAVGALSLLISPAFFNSWGMNNYYNALSMAITCPLAFYLALKIERPIHNRRGEIGIGEHYFGQTQKLDNGEFDLTGKVHKVNGKIPKRKSKRDKLQLSIYSGYGNVFPTQAYYVSMAYLEPEILEIVERGVGNISVNDAVEMSKKDIENILSTVDRKIMGNSKLSEITERGHNIVDNFAVR